MYLISVFAIVATLGLTSAVPFEIETSELNVVPSDTYSWHVTQWQACCSSNACTYKCFVQAPKYNESGIVIPAFKAKCTGRATGHFAKCQVLFSSDSTEVQASLVPLKQPGNTGSGIVSKTMGLSLSFVNAHG